MVRCWRILVMLGKFPKFHQMSSSVASIGSGTNYNRKLFPPARPFRTLPQHVFKHEKSNSGAQTTVFCRSGVGSSKFADSWTIFLWEWLELFSLSWILCLWSLILASETKPPHHNYSSMEWLSLSLAFSLLTCLLGYSLTGMWINCCFYEWVFPSFVIRA